ncbi:LacI family DNA-binding transcriptional regulator [Variovorax terrae]|uniref:LacI family DNA-binding transcriptional regulator n=1 Tax=Variovorax terrae TaxID=2923278 RepID=A0A9X2AM18_9BURK|nr:LacI family DNA-binding transcriptional regulator [Variovorax terrae]MCJ0762260.1 LacI family DNA-binding transcriptional regulator [Variovorax terrae]
MNPVKISEIAKAAGVSTATVDRVLNDRGGVNPATTRRVKEVLESLGGVASTPGRPKSAARYRFGFVLPNTRQAFFDAVDRVIAQSAGEFRHQHITEVTMRLPPHDASAFAEEVAKLSDYDGLAILAPDVPPVKLAINELVQAGVHVVTLFSDVAGSRRAAFLGTDNRAAGRTAALLLGLRLNRYQAGKTALFSPATRYAAEIDRRIGYAQLMEERFPSVQIQRFLELPESEEEAYRYALECLPPADSSDAMFSAYSVGAGSFGIARALSEKGYSGKALFAVHELVEIHRSLLANNSVDFVLHQDIYPSVSAAARTLRALDDGVRGALATFHNPRVEIVTQENLA